MSIVEPGSGRSKRPVSSVSPFATSSPWSSSTVMVTPGDRLVAATALVAQAALDVDGVVVAVLGLDALGLGGARRRHRGRRTGGRGGGRGTESEEREEQPEKEGNEQ